MPDDDSPDDGVAMRMCIRRRNEWGGLLLGSGYEELLVMTVADL
jgi:hypothetical protein